MRLQVNWSLQKKTGSQGFKIISNRLSVDVRLVIGVSITISLVFLFYVFFVVLFLILLRGSMLVNLTRCMRYWDDLSVTQILARRMGHLKKGRLAE